MSVVMAGTMSYVQHCIPGTKYVVGVSVNNVTYIIILKFVDLMNLALEIDGLRSFYKNLLLMRALLDLKKCPFSLNLKILIHCLSDA